MHDDRRLVEGRLRRALSQRIRPAQYAASVPLEVEVWHVPGEPVPVTAALAAEYRPFEPGMPWGPPWSTSWFRLTGTVPAGWAGGRAEAVIDLGFVGDWPGNQAEALVYDLAGEPVKGIAPRNCYVPVARPCRGGEPVGLLMEAAANPDILAGGFVPTPLGDRATAGNAPLYRLARADLALLDEEVWHLGLDMEVLSELMAELDLGDPRRHEILRALERALDVLDVHDVSGTAAASRAELAETLSKPAHASAHTISAVGHAHIDSAWLWPVRETIRKTSRTFANVTALAAEYPEFVFACSQAQQYVWVKQRYPAIFQRIAEAIKAGQWIPVGGMWVEPDANLPGGEALARQLIHGSRLFLDEFGVACEGVWLPDSFGYTAAFPQLARLAGMRWLLTQKLSWNQTNKLPHHTFWWEGIDGTRVFTHFPPVDTYNATFSGEELAHAVRNYAEKGRGTRSLAPFGHGDGGGGPTREMLEKARRLRDLEGSPKVVIEPPDEFFRAAEAEYSDAPVWSGELYLELHRATYTTQSRTKAGNRRSEHLLREAELWAATANVHSGFTYPYEELDRLWKVVLLHQFHDILPGSSIAWVHKEAEAAYVAVKAALEGIIADAMAAVGAPFPWVFNAGPRSRAEVLTVDPGVDLRGAQPLSNGQVAVHATVPALGAAPVGQVHDFAPVNVNDRVLDNGLVRVTLDDDGLFTSVLDLESGREVLPPGRRGNVLQLHPDLPNEWDAWDIDQHYRRCHVDLTAAESIATVEKGPLAGEIRVVRLFGASRLTQTIRLCAGSRRIDVVTEIDWHESEKILKAAFPIDVHADRSAAEIQFGHVFRPTHANTSWDAARFEIYAHRWIHVAEAGYGVAVLNDSTYGHDVTRATRDDGGTTTTVRLSLVRAPHSPDPHADQGTHRMTYSLLPAASIADAVAEGYALNLPLRVAVPPNGSGEGEAPPPALVTVDNPAVVVEAVKLADDRSGDVVVRLYESLGGRATATVRAGFPLAAAAIIDLLERPDSLLTLAADGSCTIRLRPFQILTLRLTRA
ncbi:MAG TPA: glycoside hydrolase family 38 C-terminal domain-containing protein [Amycolatopsis sp.]|uniref:alpha-mannosidase n=1 Tax=Amycolatopsis sp. TaxID=37632 RepID=UPI002B494A53|nr:glycoside hydrolase family 38 C-terminal domain-containing protein [Amycolatopsis sp.]HKS47610.1 glycoside hydrolase family 38 C-terminal domain-containing protein [Amycolatopsis sp.]